MRKRLLIIGLVVVIVLAALGSGAVYANNTLSARYSAASAVSDYFAAQKRGDVNGMLSNATFLRGDGSFVDLFGEGAIRSMLALPQNTDIQAVKIQSTRVVDDSTRSVTVSMTWNKVERTNSYTVRKDPTRVHYQFYDSWRVDIPYVTIRVTLPLQGGAIVLDGLPLPPGSGNSIQTIEGFHTVTMEPNFLYDGKSQVVDASSGGGTTTFADALSAAAVKAAGASVASGFKACDTVAYTNCFNHTYYAPVKAYTIYYLTYPGYAEIDFNKYVLDLTSDPTATMTLTVATDPGVLTVTGPCAATLTVDGSRHYYFKGSFDGTLTWTNGAFVASLGWDCAKNKA